MTTSESISRSFDARLMRPPHILPTECSVFRAAELGSAAGARTTAFPTVDAGTALDGLALLAASVPDLACGPSALDIRVVPDLPMMPAGKIPQAELIAQATAVYGDRS
ncbi:hypothetical protein [Salinarimonas soli]|uniref:AMP-binding enzyme C-terminal domain-containing protein n=1 Tax=Salinarimonas soli TaxID=1638099 RepID=A0A5B2V9H5_9HYPH|nr:hypothetical protein [Salinarimonas soli]KAA2235624.1 hypothetical protein F0L46_19205 [Salinarimonas soli]